MSTEKKEIVREIEDMMRAASKLSERINAYSKNCHAYFAINRAWKELGDARGFMAKTTKDHQPTKPK